MSDHKKSQAPYTPLHDEDESPLMVGTEQQHHRRPRRVVVAVLFIASLLTYMTWPSKSLPSTRTPSTLPASWTDKLPLSSTSSQSLKPVRKIAIIGGGAGGTSTAYFLSRFAKEANQDVEIRLFEKNGYIGGRSTIIYPFDEEPTGLAQSTPYYDPIEAGASIFVDANRHLQQAVKTFNLTTLSYGGEEDGGRLGIWDGTEFVFEQSGPGWDWWDKGKMFWRYGKSPLTIESMKDKVVSSFLSIYNKEFITAGPFNSHLDWAKQLGSDFSHYLTVTAQDFFIEEHNLNALCVKELVELATRVNYGVDVSSIHALGALVSMATNGAVSVRGGNRQIFEQFAVASSAHVTLGASITEVAKLDGANGSYSITYQDVQDPSLQATETFDAVILAAPFHQTGIKFPASIARVPEQPYIHLYVTFVATNQSAPIPAAFAQADGHDMPKTIYSTMMRNVEGRGIRPKFNSLSYLRNLGKREGVEGDVHIIKLFSESHLSDAMLYETFGPSSNVLWTKHIEWKSYPFLAPIVNEDDIAPVRLEQGLYYVNGFERLISTMETETVSGWNVASLLAHDAWNYKPTEGWAEEH